MGKSFKKNPFTGITCAESEKKDKQFANRKFRRRNKHKIMSIRNYEEDPEIIENIREISNVYSFEKDGKTYYDKDDEWYKKIKRK